MYQRSQRRIDGQNSQQDSRRMTAAIDAAKQVLAGVPERVIGSADRGEELKPPLELVPSGRRVGPQPSSSASPAQPRAEPTPEERRRMLLYERELAALDAPTRSGSGPTDYGSPSLPALPTRSGDVAEMSALLQAIQPTAANPGTPPTTAVAALSRPLWSANLPPNSPAEEYRLQNMQEEKAAFLESARKKSTEDYLAATRVAPITNYVIRAGWDIPAVLEQGINSDLPAEIRALVRENVYDTASGRHLLIPQGARLVGRYNAQVAFGQSGLQVVWGRVIFPDASSIDLGGMSGQDAIGRAGFRHSVDNHYKRIFGFGLLTSVLSAAFQLSQTQRGGILATPSSAEVAGAAVGREMAMLGAETARRNLNVQPTIKIPAGYRFNVRVNRDLAFEEAYRPL